MYRRTGKKKEPGTQPYGKSTADEQDLLRPCRVIER
jgi:hypothetical protein